METGNKSRRIYGQIERLLPEWLFHPENEERKRIALIAYPTIFIAVFVLIILGGVRLLQHYTVIGIVYLSFAMFLVGILLYHRKSKAHDSDTIAISGIAAYGLFSIYLFFFNPHGSHHFIWSYLFPLMVFPILGAIQGTVAVILFLMPASLLLIVDPSLSFMTSYPRSFVLPYIVSILTVSGLSYLYERNRERGQQQLKQANITLQRTNEEIEKQVQQRTVALSRSEEKYRNILENIGEAYFEIDLKGNMTFCNDSTCSVSGYSQSELMNMNYRQYTSPEAEKKLRAIFKNIYNTGEKGSLYDFEVIRKDKGIRNMELSVNLMRNSEGEAIGFRCIARDLTIRSRIEEEKRRLEERLQRAEKMEALGTLAGGVAHDLNNVLGVLVGYSELLLQSVPQESPFQRHATQIFRGGVRAAAIIQDLLTLTRRGVLLSETLNLNSIITDFLQMPEFEAIRSHHPGIQFKTSLDTELLNMKGSSTHLSKTVMNLLSNAAEAISGSGEVLIRTENRYVDRPIHGYDTTQEGEYAVLTVSDTGSGISSSDIGRIFEPFYTKKVMGRSGTGLGLAVVWGTVKDHDGYIDVQSTEGAGSIFTLYFPVTRKDLTTAEQVVPQSTYLGRGEHILVVDDVEGQRLLASAMLDSLGYKVSSVASGEEAVEFVEKQPVDLLILDMIMDPGMDGLDTYRSILDIRPQQKAIIVSGFSATDRVHAAHALGAGAYVRKPYVIEKLGLAIKNELNKT